MSSSLTPIRDQLIALGEGTVEQRAKLDALPQFLPINLEALKTSLGHVIATQPEDILDDEGLSEYNKLRARKNLDVVETAVLNEYSSKIVSETISFEDLAKKISDWLRGKYNADRTYDIVTKSLGGKQVTHVDILEKLGSKSISRSGERPGILFVRGNTILGVLYPNYKSTYETIFRTFISKEITSFINKKWRQTITADDGTQVNIKAGFDIGHILGTPGLADTPLGLKFRDMLNILNNIANPTQLASQLTSTVKDAFSELSQKSSYGPKILASVEKEFGQDFQILKTLKVNIVIIQESAENRYIYGTLLEGKLGGKVAKLIPGLNMSRNLIEEFQYRLENIHKGVFKFPKSSGRKDLKPIDVPVKAINITANKTPKTKIKVPRSVKPAAVVTENLSSLQALLDARLVDVVKQNMGRGGSRDILNLRTGRFAESVKVERLSSSRQGMITAFYTYMRNPYATFSRGGKQEFPRSRDPKLLISKSIREVAAQLVGTKLRAQLI